MNSPRSTLFMLAATITLLPAAIPAQTPDQKLKAVLSELDASSKNFHSAHASFTSDNYQAVVHESDTQTGITYFERTPSGMEFGSVVYGPKAKPSDKDRVDKIVAYKNGSGQLFDLSVDQIRVLKAGNNSTAQTFLTLGFGGSGQDLARAWNITYLGPETLNDSGQPVKTEKLELTSKDEGIRNNYTKITIWIDPSRDVTLRQVFDTPSHDRRTVNFSHIVPNGKLDKAPFAIKKGPHTTVVN